MTIQRLFPSDHETDRIPLEGLYLGLNLHQQAASGDILVYSNYIASMDGRISRYNPDIADYAVPESLANDRDWRLYQELAAQSDILITSARYFRQLSSNTAQDMLPVGDQYPELLKWREAQGFNRQPAVAILSRSLEIPHTALEKLKNRDIYIFTSTHAPDDKKKKLASHGIKVLAVGESVVEGIVLKKMLIQLGFRSAYMIAGPQVHCTLIADGVLDQLFLSTRFTLLGESHTHGLCEGELNTPANMQLKALYLDKQGQQIFSHYILEKL